MLFFLLLVAINSHSHTHSKKEIEDQINSISVMYGSTIRIKAAAFNYQYLILSIGYSLHSHQVMYPMGSGYQSVTGFPHDNDYNSLWTIKEAHGDYVKTYRKSLIISEQPVKCGDVIRLEHALTRRNLHSEQIFQSMVTKNQEVSAFGNGGNGNQSKIILYLDDNWIVRCMKKKEGE